METAPAKRIGILIDTATGWGRNIIRGINGYACEAGNWDLLARHYLQTDYIELPPQWNCQGVIARIASPRMAGELAKTGLPVVNVSSLPLDPDPFPRVLVNFNLSGRLAAEHLLDLGFSSFAFCAPAGAPSASKELYAGYQSALEENGFVPHQHSWRQGKSATPSRNAGRMLEWLRKQTFPLAILTWSVETPHDIVEACHLGGIAIPEEVAIISNASADELLLQIGSPPVSCVDSPETAVGYTAAELLNRMMTTGDPEPFAGKRILIDPSHVAARESTDILQLKDPGLVKAIRYIRENALGGITVGDVAKHTGLSRRSLEQKMRSQMHRSPAEEIRLIRLNRAKDLLRNSLLPVADVAESAGFGTVEHFITSFRKTVGLTPLQYARKHRLGGLTVGNERR